MRLQYLVSFYLTFVNFKEFQIGLIELYMSTKNLSTTIFIMIVDFESFRSITMEYNLLYS